MYSNFREITVRSQQQELDRFARTAFLRRGRSARAVPTEALILRLCTVNDDAALDRLAELEGRPEPKGRHVVAEVGGTIVAALPLLGGEALADPFRATAHVVPLLELRARQLSGESRRGLALRGAARGWSRA